MTVLRYGADKTLKADNGLTPFDYARSRISSLILYNNGKLILSNDHLKLFELIHQSSPPPRIPSHHLLPLLTFLAKYPLHPH